jgi:hypothetical protein
MLTNLRRDGRMLVNLADELESPPAASSRAIAWLGA